MLTVHEIEALSPPFEQVMIQPKVNVCRVKQISANGSFYSIEIKDCHCILRVNLVSPAKNSPEVLVLVPRPKIGDYKDHDHETNG
jgi:hypothetical protein